MSSKKQRALSKIKTFIQNLPESEPDQPSTTSKKKVYTKKYYLKYGSCHLNNPAKTVSNMVDTLASELSSAPANPPYRTSNWWRAALLCISDRYGSGGFLKHPLPLFSLWGEHINLDTYAEDCEVQKKMANQIRKTCIAAADWTKCLRYWFGQRTDQQRVQMQRPLNGRSLLSITQSISKAHARSLNALLVASIHPTRGVSTVRYSKTSDFEGMPFMLPKALQPEQPKLTNNDRTDETPRTHAKKINKLLSNIYNAVKNDPQDPPTPEDIFVSEWNLKNETNWKDFGNLPDNFDTSTYYHTIVPWVKPGKEIILWKTWHTTCGFKDKIPMLETNVTSFVDCVPATYLNINQNGKEYTDLQEWYYYLAKHAPCDPGGGSARGTWQMMAYKTYEHLQNPSVKKNIFGLPRNIMNHWVSSVPTKTHIVKVGSNQLVDIIPALDIGGQSDTSDTETTTVSKSASRNRHYLTSEQLQKFDEEGYLVIPIPDDLQQKCPSSECLDNFTTFFKIISNDPTFDVKSVESLQRSEELKKSKTYWDHNGDIDNPSFHYFTRRIKCNSTSLLDTKTKKAKTTMQKIWDPFWPNTVGSKGVLLPPNDHEIRIYSQNAQSGGKLIAADSGMGPGTTYTNERNHLKFQFSDFVTDIMQSFYRINDKDVPLLRVLERFRMKTKSEWGKAHVDIKGAQLLPEKILNKI